ncbi:leucine-rich repeat-containing G-protein coupled receptor 4-like [Pecten maximus]|uniref:leucine-rich repeat-containing G-protein coupled receptor 4-like n=1 Tax=Pecten maximus TaxID=6579 RepID=UPI001458D8F7|nr:leucine-rich repeat-containing G-protein coupled receptor 4-like [Pecten maximus]
MVPSWIKLAVLVALISIHVDAIFLSSCFGCTCIDGSRKKIDCSSRHLTAVPDGVKNQSDIYEINLSGNNLTHIRRSDFLGTTAKYVDLSNNVITAIDDDAFLRTPDIEILDLHNNMLSALPVALNKLTKINTLDVRDNPHGSQPPISLTNSIMKEMGDTIQTFQFGHSRLDSWPQTIDHFQDLLDLTLDHSSDQLEVIPPRAFHSFKSTLLKLTIKNTKLKAVPLGVSSLRRIEEFHFDSNLDVGNEGVVAQAFFREDSSLKTLSLINDNLTRFPRALAYISNLQSLDMSHNRLDFISDESVGDLRISNLTMQYCNLDRIPGALFHLNGLKRLDMSHNNLVTVENNDIQNILQVSNLTLSYNPIKFISNTAFGNHSELKHVDLSSTKLTAIPEAFNTTHVDKINLKDSPVDCMCDYVWVHESIDNFQGCCNNIEESIGAYVKYYVPLCPEYIEKYGRDPSASSSPQAHPTVAGKHCKDLIN